MQQGREVKLRAYKHALLLILLHGNARAFTSDRDVVRAFLLSFPQPLQKQTAEAEKLEESRRKNQKLRPARI